MADRTVEFEIGKNYRITIDGDERARSRQYVGRDPDPVIDTDHPKHVFARPITDEYAVILASDDVLLNMDGENLTFAFDGLYAGLKQFSLRAEPKIDDRCTSRKLLNMLNNHFGLNF